MRIASFRTASGTSFGLVRDDGVVDLGRRLSGRIANVNELMRRKSLELALSYDNSDSVDLRLNEISLVPPIPGPTKIFTILLNYESVRREQNRPKLVYPHLLTRFADCLVGSEQPLIAPRATKEFDFEGEIAVIIGDGGRDIPATQAGAHIAGYSCFNDAGARDWMRHTRHFTAGKNFPSTAGFGPWIATRDSIDDPKALSLVTRLNGTEMQRGRIDDLTFPIEELIAYISKFTPLSPGDVVATGTPGGSGYKQTPPRFLAPGDIVEVEVAGVGTLRNEIVAEAT